MTYRAHEKDQAILNLVAQVAEKLSDAFRHDNAVFTIKTQWVGQPPIRDGRRTLNPELRVTLNYGGTDTIDIPLFKGMSHHGIVSPGGGFEFVARLFHRFAEAWCRSPTKVMRELADELDAEGAEQ